MSQSIVAATLMYIYTNVKHCVCKSHAKGLPKPVFIYTFFIRFMHSDSLMRSLRVVTGSYLGISVNSLLLGLSI